MIVALEGPDGGGKTTQAAAVSAALEARGIAASAVKLPFLSSPAVRELVPSIKALERADPEAGGAMRASAVSLATHHEATRLVVPRHEAGEVVVCDRYLVGPAAYLETSVPPAAARTFEAVRALLPPAGLSVLVDVPVEEALARAERAEGTVPAEVRAHVERMAARLAALADAGELVRVDGTASVEAVRDAVVALVEERLGAP